MKGDSCGSHCPVFWAAAVRAVSKHSLLSGGIPMQVGRRDPRGGGAERAGSVACLPIRVAASTDGVTRDAWGHACVRYGRCGRSLPVAESWVVSEGQGPSFQECGAGCGRSPGPCKPWTWPGGRPSTQLPRAPAAGNPPLRRVLACEAWH